MKKGYKLKVRVVCTVCKLLRIVYRCDRAPYSPAEQEAMRQAYVCGDHEPGDLTPVKPACTVRSVGLTRRPRAETLT